MNLFKSKQSSSSPAAPPHLQLQQTFKNLQTHFTNFLQTTIPQLNTLNSSQNSPLWAKIGVKKQSLSTETIEERLGGVPVYALSNASQEFVLVSGVSTGKSLGLFCFSEADAEALRQQMESMDPSMRNGSRVVPVALNKVFQLKVDGVAFRLIPEASQVKNAIKERERTGTTDESFYGVPVFQPNNKKKISIRRRKTCSSIVIKEEENSSDQFNKLSADVLTCIFLKCTVKTLSISRCVSKSWNDCIISPMFVRSHQKQQLMENAPQLLFVKTFRYLRRSGKLKLQFISLDMEGRNEDLYTITHYPDRQIHSSRWTVSAGLVCLSTDCRIYLCNPAIHQLRELPECSPSAIPGYEHFGFGYLHSKKEYKVARFFYMGPPGTLPVDVVLAQLRCEVFTLNSGGILNSRWKEIAEQPPYHPVFPGVLVNECMYWLAKDEVVYYGQPRVMSFEFENEKFISICCPSAFVDFQGLDLMDLKGTVCLPDYANFLKSSILDLWILKDKVSCSWAKEYSINLGVRFDPEELGCFYSSWNEEIIFRQQLGVMMVFFFYDIKTKCFRQVEIHGRGPYHIYWKTLFSLDS